MSTQQKEKTAGTGTSQAEVIRGLSRTEREHVATLSGDIIEAQIGKLRGLFPEVSRSQSEM
jgi:hypothetical protein